MNKAGFFQWLGLKGDRGPSRFALYVVTVSIILLVLLAGTLAVFLECGVGSCTVAGTVAASATVALPVLIIWALMVRSKRDGGNPR